MATKTINYNLTKPSYSEDADISVINSNMDIIDSKMKEIEDKAGTGGSGGSNVEWNQIQTTGSKIAEVTIDGTMTEVYAPSESGGGGGSDSSVELTQAEYDALPDTKLTDNKNYFIKDGKGGGSGSKISLELLFSNDSKQISGTIELPFSMSDYDLLLFEVTNSINENWVATTIQTVVPKILVENQRGFLDCVAGTWRAISCTDTSITLGEGSSYATLKSIYGIKY